MGDNYSLSFFERERKKEQDRKLCGVASKVNSTEIVWILRMIARSLTQPLIFLT